MASQGHSCESSSSYQDFVLTKSDGSDSAGPSGVFLIHHNLDPQKTTQHNNPSLPPLSSDVASLHAYDEDDISWYFDDGRVPDRPSLDTSLLESLSMDMDLTSSHCASDIVGNSTESNELITKVSDGNPHNKLSSDNLDTTTSHNSITNASRISHISNENGRSGYVKADRDDSGKVLGFKGKTQLPSTSQKCPALCDVTSTESWDEFDNCFNGINQQITSQNKDAIEMDSEDEFGDCFNGIQYKVTSKALIPMKGDLQDEYRACFENVNQRGLASQRFMKKAPEDDLCESVGTNDLDSSVSNEPLLETGSSLPHHPCGRYSPNHTKPHLSDQTEGLERELNCCDDNPTRKDSNSLQHKLEAILKLKKKKVPSSLSTSRHFRTIHTSVNEMTEAYGIGTRLPRHHHTETVSAEDDPSHETLNAQASRESSNGDLSNQGGSRHMSDDSSRRLDISTHDSPKVTSTGNTTCEVTDKVSTIVVGELSVKSRHCDEPCLSDVERVAMGLSHGCDDMMKWVVKAYRCSRIPVDPTRCSRINSPVDPTTFELWPIHTHCMTGPDQKNTRLLEGLVLPTDITSSTLLAKTSSTRRALLINGDLRPSYKHTGYKQKQMVSLVGREVQPVGSDQLWLEEAGRFLLDLQVSALLVRGVMESNMKDFCQDHGILVFTGVPYKALQAVASCTNVPMATYITECTREYVVDSMDISPFSLDWLNHIQAHTSPLACITTPGFSMQTLVLCHPCEVVVNNQEEQFWHCASRLRNTLRVGKILKGQGHTEITTAKYLEMRADTMERETGGGEHQVSYHPAILRAIASAFSNYNQIVQRNISSIQPPIYDSCEETVKAVVYDDFKAKTAAWHCAAHVVSQIMLLNSEVITGHDSASSLSKRGKILL